MTASPSDDDHPLVVHISERLDAHLPLPREVSQRLRVQDEQGNLRCPADDEIVVPSPEWLGW